LNGGGGGQRGAEGGEGGGHRGRRGTAGEGQPVTRKRGQETRYFDFTVQGPDWRRLETIGVFLQKII
jgi:hypothetical protein